MALDRRNDFAAAREPQFMVELASIVEADDVFGLFGKEFFGFREEFE